MPGGCRLTSRAGGRSVVPPGARLQNPRSALAQVPYAKIPGAFSFRNYLLVFICGCVYTYTHTENYLISKEGGPVRCQCVASGLIKDVSRFCANPFREEAVHGETADGIKRG